MSHAASNSHVPNLRVLQFHATNLHDLMGMEGGGKSDEQLFYACGGTVDADVRDVQKHHNAHAPLEKQDGQAVQAEQQQQRLLRQSSTRWLWRLHCLKSTRDNCTIHGTLSREVHAAAKCTHTHRNASAPRLHPRC